MGCVIVNLNLISPEWNVRNNIVGLVVHVLRRAITHILIVPLVIHSCNISQAQPIIVLGHQ